MKILRAKTKNLFEGRPLTEMQSENSRLNLQELEAGETVLTSHPRRLVFELTNACNLNCMMCGRNAAEFHNTRMSMETFSWFEPMLDIVEEVTLMGWGEPTTHPRFEEMLRRIHEHSARIYFATNGMNLGRLTDAIFENEVDVFAVSVDGATQETNGRIRRGSDLERISGYLRRIVEIRNERGLSYPWINFIFCAMRSNIHELGDVVRLAAELGIDEVKVVYLTVFEEALLKESLWGEEKMIRTAFEEAVELGERLHVALKLPHIPGEDVAGHKLHRDCFTPWRDFFLGSDGYVRPCMSTPVKFFRFDPGRDFMDMWNDKCFQDYRACVNDGEQMDRMCRRCYQSSHCNWNRREAFVQIGEQFSPDWE